MTAKSVELEGGKSSEKSANNNDDYSECSEDFATRIKGCSQDNLAGSDAESAASCVT